MGGRWLGRKRLLIIALAGGAISALTAVAALAAPWQFFAPWAINLSQAPAVDSYFSDIAASPDGERAVAVWPQAYQTGSAPRGSVLLRWTSESQGNDWSAPVTVFTGTGSLCAAEAAVAITETTAHIAYLVWSPCTGATQRTLYYKTCELGGPCESGGTLIETVSHGPNDLSLSEVDIALDGDGNPHLVYILYGGSGSEVTSTVHYRWIDAGSLQPIEKLTTSDHNCHNPSIAWANGFVHVAWEDETDYEILYRRRSGSGWEAPFTLSGYMGNENYHPRNPNITTAGNEIIVTWDWHWPDAEPNQYILAYRRYHQGTWSSIREVGTDTSLEEGGTPENLYLSTDIAFPSEYTTFLRPTVGLDGQGNLTVVWHANVGSVGEPTYALLYTQGQEITTSNTISWSTPARLDRNTEGQAAGPVVAMAPVFSPHVHVVYLQQEAGDWETFYKSGGRNYPLIFLPIALGEAIGK